MDIIVEFCLFEIEVIGGIIYLEYLIYNFDDLLEVGCQRENEIVFGGCCFREFIKFLWFYFQEFYLVFIMKIEKDFFVVNKGQRERKINYYEIYLEFFL